jgi:hypothetical protein
MPCGVCDALLPGGGYSQMNFLKSAICQMLPTFDPSAAFTHWWASSKKFGSISFIRTGISGPAARQRGNRLDDSDRRYSPAGTYPGPADSRMEGPQCAASQGTDLTRAARILPASFFFIYL